MMRSIPTSGSELLELIRMNMKPNSYARKWAGCPQALQGRKCNPNESKTRIWLLDDGTAEVSLGAEVSILQAAATAMY
jgi:hypothetical protein